MGWTVITSYSIHYTKLYDVFGLEIRLFVRQLNVQLGNLLVGGFYLGVQCGGSHGEDAPGLSIGREGRVELFGNPGIHDEVAVGIETQEVFYLLHFLAEGLVELLFVDFQVSPKPSVV